MPDEWLESASMHSITWSQGIKALAITNLEVSAHLKTERLEDSFFKPRECSVRAVALSCSQLKLQKRNSLWDIINTQFLSGKEGLSESFNYSRDPCQVERKEISLPKDPVLDFPTFMVSRAHTVSASTFLMCRAKIAMPLSHLRIVDVQI